MHILIVKHGALGDVVRTSYFAHALKIKYGKCLRLSWLTSAQSLPILKFNNYIDDLWSDSSECMNHFFDHIYSLDDEFEVVSAVNGMKTAKLTGAYMLDDKRITYSNDSSAWFDMGLLSRFGKTKADQLKKENKRSHADIFSEIFQVQSVTPGIDLGDDFKDWAESVKSGARYIVGINPFAGGRWTSKELRDTEFEKLCCQLLDKYLGECDKIVLIGAFNDRKRNIELAAKLDDDRIFVPNTDESIIKLGQLIAQLDYLITSDSLALHLAVANRIPFLSFFAPTSSVEIDSFGLGVKIYSTADDYCSYRKDADNLSITADRILDTAISHSLFPFL